MASVRSLKKNINYVLGDIIEAVYLWEIAGSGKPSEASSAIIDEAISVFDTLIGKVNAKNVDNKRTHFKAIQAELEESARALVDKINKLK